MPRNRPASSKSRESLRKAVIEILARPEDFPKPMRTWITRYVELHPQPHADQIVGYTRNFLRSLITLTYSATIATDASAGRHFKIVATNGTAFTISNPTQSGEGMEIIYDIKNSSGGAMGAITWGANFLLAGAFTNPANTKRRTIMFYYDGTNWVEVCRAAADI